MVLSLAVILWLMVILQLVVLALVAILGLQNGTVAEGELARCFGALGGQSRAEGAVAGG